MSTTTDRPPQPCQCLRTKNPYGTTPKNAETWAPGIDTTSSYWCPHTMGPAGPDEHYVHLSRCTPSRACYESSEE